MNMHAHQLDAHAHIRSFAEKMTMCADAVTYKQFTLASTQTTWHMAQKCGKVHKKQTRESTCPPSQLTVCNLTQNALLVIFFRV